MNINEPSMNINEPCIVSTSDKKYSFCSPWRFILSEFDCNGINVHTFCHVLVIFVLYHCT